MLRRLAICAAFATWFFLDTWVEFAEGESAYFARHDPLHAVAIPVLVWELVLTVSMIAVWEVLRRRGRTRSRWLHGLFLASCLVPLGIAAVAAVRASPADLIPLIRARWFWPAALAVSTVPVGAALLRPYAASRLMRGVFLYSWPVLAVVLAQAARETLFRYPAASYRDSPVAAPFRNVPKGVRVVWIIFDELSQSIAFDNRPPGMPLPNLDQLKAGSFFAAAASSPGASTRISMPSLILGEPVVEAIPRGPDNLYVRTRSQAKPVPLSAISNVFDDARALGFNTALVGWYHPYGRLLPGCLTQCYWTPQWLNPGIEERLIEPPLAYAMWDRARLQLAALPGAGHLPGLSPDVYQRQEKMAQFSRLLSRALETVADPSIGLVLVHLPIPHPPSIYSPSEGALTTKGRMGYLDNIALTDRTLGVLRRSMQEAGVWNQSAVLVSADHGWRTSFWRGGPEWTAAEETASHEGTANVPFLLKLPGQTSSATYTKALLTIVTRRLITEILSGRLTDPAAIPGAIERIEADTP
jgi:hypothetical protein